eukprot:6771669-Prymnesium_polylepis.1
MPNGNLSDFVRFCDDFGTILVCVWSGSSQALHRVVRGGREGGLAPGPASIGIVLRIDWPCNQ